MARSGGTVVSGPTLDTVLWVAHQVLRQHNEPPDPTRATGSCSQCQDGACPMYAWAADTVDYYAPRPFAMAGAR